MQIAFSDKPVQYYNLNIIISVGYRVNTVRATRFRIWVTQKAIAALFGVTVPNISYHLGRIFKSGEMEADAVVKEILITAQSGARGLFEKDFITFASQK